jgi:hypothetical protein
MSFRLQYIRPENRGVLGFLKHTARRATSKEYWPLSLGFLIATAAFMSVPVTGERLAAAGARLRHCALTLLSPPPLSLSLSPPSRARTCVRLHTVAEETRKQSRE